MPLGVMPGPSVPRSSPRLEKQPSGQATLKGFSFGSTSSAHYCWSRSGLLMAETPPVSPKLAAAVNTSYILVVACLLHAGYDALRGWDTANAATLQLRIESVYLTYSCSTSGRCMRRGGSNLLHLHAGPWQTGCCGFQPPWLPVG